MSAGTDGLPTVVDRFADSLERRPAAVAVTLVERSDAITLLSYEDLYRDACRAARGFAELGLGPGDRAVLALPTCRATLGAYLAALATGIVPIVAPPPRGAEVGEPFATQLRRLAEKIGASWVLLPDAAKEGLCGRLGAGIATAGELLGWGELPCPLAAAPEGIAHLQSTSGSTGEPKVAVIRHRNISANVRAIGRAIGEREGDRVVSWLPLYHDMGLICLSCVLSWQRPLVLTDAANFVRHPINYWLRLISDLGGTISPAPTSAYQVCARLAGRRPFPGLDLSAWRVGFCGAEPVHRQVLEGFQRAFAPYGLPATTLLPVYGLAEATLAVTIPPVGEPPTLEEIESSALESAHQAVPADRGSERILSMVSVGGALEDHEVRVVGGDGRPLGERRVGEVEVRGPSVIDGYWGELDSPWHPESNGHLRTGDLGYLADGRLFITGRRKEIILLRGRNLLAGQIEAVVSEIVATGIPNGVAALGLWSEAQGTEELHLLIESRTVPPADRWNQEENVRAALQEAFEVGGATFHWLAKGGIPKTSSGKIQRHRCQELARGLTAQKWLAP